MAQPVLTGTGFTAIRVGAPSDLSTSPSQQGTSITYIERGTVTVTPAAIGAGTSGDTAVTIANARTTDTIEMTPPATALAAGLIKGQTWCSAAGTVQVRIGNITAGSLTPASGTWSYVIIRS